MSATAEAWLDDVIEHPKDDAPRLIFADWLEEHGEQARAEFIRVQCELARMPTERRGGLTVWGSDEAAADAVRADDPRAERLRRRERELLRCRVQDWIPPVSGLAVWAHFARDREPQYGWLDRPPGAGGTGLPVTFRRGFPAEVTCRLGDWCGGRCEQCLGRGRLDARDWRRPRECPECGGTGRTPGHGPALVRAAPLERVTLSDREPQNYHNNPSIPGHDGPLFGWRRETNGRYGLPYNLPPDVWDRVAEHPRRIDNGQWADFRERADALDALSEACLAWANAEADRAAR